MTKIFTHPAVKLTLILLAATLVIWASYVLVAYGHAHGTMGQ